MRTIALGLLLAAGASMPALAAAQDRDHPHHEGRPAGGRPQGGFHPGHPPRPAPAPRAQAQPQPGGRPDTYTPGFQPQVQQAWQRPDRGGDRPQGGPRGFGVRGDRPDGAPPVAAGWGGDRPRPGQYGDRPDATPPGAPGWGGYRPQPGQYGYRPNGGPPVAPGSGGYRPQPGQYGYRPAPPPPGSGWNRGWRDDRRYDFRSYRTDNTYVFRLQPYYAPRGWSWGYRRFSPGFTLSAFLFDQGYWIDDPYDYRLPPAWGPYRWVRYYNDALLVDVRSGVVVDAVYGIFWQ